MTRIKLIPSRTADGRHIVLRAEVRRPFEGLRRLARRLRLLAAPA